MPVLLSNGCAGDSGTITALSSEPSILAVRFGITSDVLRNLVSTSSGAALLGIVSNGFDHDKLELGFTVDGSGNINVTEKFANNSQSVAGVGNSLGLTQAAVPSSGTAINGFVWYNNTALTCGCRLYSGGTLIFSRSDTATGGGLDTGGTLYLACINDWALLSGVNSLQTEYLYLVIDNVMPGSAAAEQLSTTNGNTLAAWGLNDASSGSATSASPSVGGSAIAFSGGGGATWVSGGGGSSVSLTGFQLSLGLGTLAPSSGTTTVSLTGLQLALGNLGAVTRVDTAITVDGFQLTIGQGIITLSAQNSISATVNPFLPALQVQLGKLVGTASIPLIGFGLQISLGHLSIQTNLDAHVNLQGLQLLIQLGVIQLSLPFIPPINPPLPPQFGPGNTLLGIYTIEGCPQTTGYSIEMCPGTPNVPPPQVTSVIRYNGVIVYDGSHTYGAS